MKAAISEKMDVLDYPEGTVQIQLEVTTFGRLPIPKRVRLTEAGVQPEESGEEWEPVPLKAMEDEERSSGSEGLVEGGPASSSGVTKDSIPLGTYVMSVVGRGNRKTLHRVGECHRVPGLHYARFEVVGNEPPCTDTFRQSCSVCFPRGLAEGGEESSEDWNEEDVSSSDSSLSVEETDEDP